MVQTGHYTQIEDNFFLVRIKQCIVSTVSNNGPDKKREPEQTRPEECNILLHIVLYFLIFLYQDDSIEMNKSSKL